MSEQTRRDDFSGQFHSTRDQWIGNTITNAHFHQPSSVPAEIPPVIDVPFRRDRYFVQRKVFDDLVRQCQETGAQVALVGLGGVGKSQLAIELAYYMRERDPDLWVFWVNGHSVARFEESYRRIANIVRCLSPTATPTSTDVLNNVQTWLSTSDRRKWLMVVDNVDDEAVMFEAGGERQPLIRYLSTSSSGRVVLTSRHKGVARRLIDHDHDMLCVGPMTSEEAAELAQKRLKSDILAEQSQHIPALVQLLEHIPLAISHAIAYINERYPRITVASYVKELSRSDNAFSQLLSQESLDARRDITALASVMRTWHISFEYLRQRYQSATRLLALMSMFDRVNIITFLLEGKYGIEWNDPDTGNDGRKSENCLASDPVFEDDISRLRSFDLIHVKTVDKNTFEMHRLVQHSIQQWLTSHNEIDMWRGRSIAVLHKAFPSNWSENQSECRAIFSHVTEAAAYSPSDIETSLRWADLLLYAGEFALDQGQYATSLGLTRKASERRKSILGSEHPFTLSSMYSLAQSLEFHGQYKEAERVYRTTLAGSESVLGPEAWLTLASMGALADTLVSLGQYTEAEELACTTLATRGRVFGPEDPDTLDTTQILAEVLRKQGKYPEAERLVRTSLATRERVLGSLHRDTIGCMFELAGILREQGKYIEAEQLARTVLATDERVFGPEHPNTINSMYSLAETFRKQGEYEKAEQYHRHVLEVSEKVLGPEHPGTLLSTWALARLLTDIGSYDEAHRLYHRASSGFVATLGPDHPRTLSCQKGMRDHGWS